MLHKKISKEIARHFLVHINAELNKKDSVNLKIGFDGQTPISFHQLVLTRIFLLFPELQTEALPERNIFIEWTKLNFFTIPYEEFSFEAYNLIFIQRIEEMFERSAKSKIDFHNETIRIFEKFDSDQQGFSVSFFIRSENNMRELIRSIIDESTEITEKEAAWTTAFEQSKEYQEVVNEFFEAVLKRAIAKSNELLDNILPHKISTELKEHGQVKPVHVKSATVIFTDFQGFTALASNMKPEKLITELDRCFSVFDRIIDRYKLEKIKTIGDSYMCAAGIPEPHPHHALKSAFTALAIRESMIQIKAAFTAKNLPYWDVRIGFHSGPIVAGVIGKKKFSYDIWGDTVNTASRMESSGIAGAINISKESFILIEPYCICTPRGKIEAKGKGAVEMYILERIKPEYSLDEAGTKPNKSLLDRVNN